MTSQPRDKTRDSTKHDTAKFGIDLYCPNQRPIVRAKCIWLDEASQINVRTEILKFPKIYKISA